MSERRELLDALFVHVCAVPAHSWRGAHPLHLWSQELPQTPQLSAGAWRILEGRHVMLNTSAPERGRACFAERSLVRRLHVSPNACESIWKNKVVMCKCSLGMCIVVYFCPLARLLELEQFILSNVNELASATVCSSQTLHLAWNNYERGTDLPFTV